MLDKIVEETNRYASQNGPDRKLQDTTREEISTFIGTWLVYFINNDRNKGLFSIL